MSSSSPAVCENTERLAALRRYSILDSPPERDFDDICHLAAQICGTPMSTLTFVDRDRQWFKSEIGVGMRETPLQNSICRHAILEDEALVVPDTLQDDRFRTNPLCFSDPNIRFYAGAVIRTADGLPLGTVCVMDRKPRQLSPDQVEALRALARQVMTMLELRRRAAEEHASVLSLARSEERYRTLGEATSDIIWTNSAEGEMLGEQPGWSRFTGQSFAEYQKFGWARAIHPDDAPLTLAAWQRSVTERRPFNFQHRVRRHDGAWRLCLIRAIPIFENGAVREWVGVHTDVTDVTAAEEKLQQALQDATKANSAKDDFLAKLSHELRTPLMPVLMTLGELLEDDTVSAQQKEHLTLIFRNVELEARLIDDLLDVTRIGHDKLELREETCDVHRLIEHALSICQPSLRDRKIKVTTRWDAAAHLVSGDPVRLQQVFWNLLTNAGKFMSEGGHLQIASSNPQPEIVRLEVTDDGIGIEESRLPSLFQVFEQGDRLVTRKFGGLGLGLAICKGILDRHGGQIRAASAGLGCGTTMTVELNVTASLKTASHGMTAKIARPAGNARSLRLLLVEDHENTAEVLLRLLRRAGHAVQHAGTIARGLQWATEETFDLVISDLGLPDGSGLELMRQLQHTHGLRGIALSGYGSHTDIAASREAGFLQHLLKPVEWKQLDETIRGFAEGAWERERPAQT